MERTLDGLDLMVERDSLYMYLPLTVIMTYLMITVLVFLGGPFEWRGIDIALLVLLLVAYHCALCLGYVLGVKQSPRAIRHFDVNRWFKFCLLTSIVVIVPATFFTTGKYPWQAWDALVDPGGAYRDLYALVTEERTPSRTAFSITRAILSPAVWATLPLLFWTSGLRLFWKALVAVYIASYISFSLLRGTDKESADIAIILFGGLLARLAIAHSAGPVQLSLAKKVLLWIAAFLFLAGGYSLFVDRKTARIGSSETACLLDVCADMNSPMLSHMDEKNRFGVAMLAGYMSHGYYGLGLALNQEFESTYGLGHSLFIADWVTKLTGSAAMYERTYTAKVDRVGWPDRVVWSTGYIWFANDLGLLGVVFVLLGVGLLLGQAWIDVLHGRNPVAFIVFCQMLILVFYLPAFNQLLQTPDSYLAAVFWVGFWLCRRSRLDKPGSSTVRMDPRS